MKLILLSYSHDCAGMLELAAQHIEDNKYDKIIHLGDFRRDAEWLSDRLGREVIGVPGNCDFMSFDSRELMMNFGGAWILMSHGDAFGVKRSYDRISYYAEEKLCKAAFFGHTHVQFAGRVGNTLLVNPGTLMNGRCAEVEIISGEIFPKLIKI